MASSNRRAREADGKSFAFLERARVSTVTCDVRWRRRCRPAKLGDVRAILLAALALSATSGCKESAAQTADPMLRDGDLIFQESTSRQSAMVRKLTGSRWTHMGVIFVKPSGPVVFEAVSPVRETPLAQWTARGKDGRYVVKRVRDDSRLAPEKLDRMKRLASSWRGRPYDPRFRWDDESLYCSELVHKLFERAAGVRIGAVERAGDMNLDDPEVKRALTARFRGKRFDPDEPVVTPRSMFEDEALVLVRRN